MSYDLKIIDGDLKFDNGDLKLVQDSEKLIQDILKICLTEAGSNPMNPAYGSYVSRSVIGSSLESEILVSVAASQLNTALENLKILQEMQAKSFQKVSADEQISAITGVSVVRSRIEPTLFDVRISVVSKGFKPVTTQFSINTI